MIEAVALAVAALAKMVTAIVEGQPLDVKKQMWDWYVEDMKTWRKFWGVDK